MSNTLAFRERSFKRKLDRVAKDARRSASSVVKMAMTAVGQPVDPKEFDEISVSGAFLAFTTLGGDFDTFESFDFDANHAELVKLAGQNTVEDYQGKGSTAWDFRARVRGRKMRASLEHYQWTSWASAGGLGSIRTRDPHKWYFSPCLGDIREAPQERDLRDRVVHTELLEALAEVLLPNEYYLFVEHYIKGRPSYPDLALEVLEAEPELKAHPQGLRRAKARIDSCLRRGRVRAKQKLHSKFAATAAEAA